MSLRSRTKLAAIFRRQKSATPETPSKEPRAILPHGPDPTLHDEPHEEEPFIDPLPPLDDPILSLTPEETLDALRQTDIVPSHVSDQHADAITIGIRNASATERALGVRAAVIGSKVRAWCIELSGWRWSGSFASSDTNPARADDGATREGSLPPGLVAERKARVDAIYDELEILDIEELKDFVRSAHLLPSSRGSSLYEMDITAPSVARHLDDFTTLITGTILMALPYVHRLNRLLSVWSLRVDVLRMVPNFLEMLWSARTAVDSAWEAIKSDGSTAAQTPRLSRDAFDTMNDVLSTRVTGLGRTIDSMLDALEGQPDTLPDPWIDSMESVQADYEEWAAIAKRLADEYEPQREASPVQNALGTARGPTLIARDDSPKASAAHFANLSNGRGPAELSTKTTYRALEASLAAPPSLLPGKNSHSLDRRDSITEGGMTGTAADRPMNGKAADTFHATDPAVVIVGNQNLGADNSDEGKVDGSKRSVPYLEVPTQAGHGNQRLQDVSPPASATSSSFASDISEPQILDASPVQLVAYASVTALSQETGVMRRGSGQTDHSLSTVQGNGDPSDSKDNPRIRSPLNQTIDRPQTPVFQDVLHHSHNEESLADHTRTQDDSTKLEDDSPASVDPERKRDGIERGNVADEAEQEEEESYWEPLREPRTLEEQISNRIRTILANLPSRIRLSSHAQHDVADAQRALSAQSRFPSGGNKVPRARRSLTPALTLAPAFDKSTPKVHSGNSEIKVYHLRSADRDRPIKLYVRLVGEEERVMVRVGGGWADLGDYLKDYAAHHGRKTAPDAKTESEPSQHRTPPRKGQDDLESLDGSSPVSDYSESPNGRVMPVLAHRKVRGPGSSALAAPPQTPDHLVLGKIDAPLSARYGSRQSEVNTAGLEDSSSAASPAALREVSTDAAHGSAARDGSPVGLGGLKRNVELSPTKQAWVDGMLNQASRHVSGEKERTQFSDLGKSGGTRRLFARSKKDND